MFKVIKYFLIIVLLLLLTVIGAFVATIESEPLFVADSAEQVNQAESVKKLMKQLSESVKNRANRQSITITQDQMNSLVGFAQRAHKPLTGKIEIKPDVSIVLVSYHLPENPLGKYFNLDVAILPGPGILVEHVKVGPFSIPGDFAVSTLVALANWYTQSDIAKQFVEQVESVAMGPQQVTLTIRPLEQFLKDLEQVKDSVKGVGDEELRLRTAYYLERLTMLDVAKKTTPQSLAKYIGPLFKLAKARSTANTAAAENEAAIMALAIFAGNYRFANFVGDVQPVEGRLALPAAGPMLRYRNDLNLHFIFSAAIKLLSEQGLSIAIGEFKELMDRSKDGSGYSFVDLAADIAGVEFARVATDPDSAVKVQNILAGKTSENLFFPSIKGLPEGMRKAEFTARFKEVDSPEYVQMVERIHARINKLPIYQ